MKGPSANKRKAVIQEILSLKHHRNRASVKCAVVAENLTFSPKEVAQVLHDLEKDGLLDAWGSSTPTTYLIEFDAEDVDVDVPEAPSPND